jgi:hypothetical protein
LLRREGQAILLQMQQFKLEHMIQAQAVKINHPITVLILKIITMTTILLNLTKTIKMMMTRKNLRLRLTQAAMQHDQSQMEQVKCPR